VRLTLMLPAAIEADWQRIGALLAPAIEIDKNAPSIGIHALLMSGQYAAIQVDLPTGSGIAVVEICELDGRLVWWLPYVAGLVGLGPKATIAALREIMSGIEKLARSVGCWEIRIGGRDWSRVFPDFERFDDVPNRLRKVL